MSKSKLTLLIDGNWLLMSRLSVLNNNIDNFQFCQDLKILIIRSINVVLRNFPLIDNIIFCADGGSWRSKVAIPKSLYSDTEQVEYKGNRQYSQDIDWDYIFGEYESFMAVLQQTGITVCRENDIEGDDWIYYWSSKLNKEGTNCIIWTKDNDLKQLVHVDKNKCFTIWYNKDVGIFTDRNIEDENNEFNFMFNYEFDTNEQIFESLSKKTVKINVINPKHIVIDKILRGDASDNILPILLRQTKSKKYKISTKDIDFDLDYNNDNEVHAYLEGLLAMPKYAKTEKTIDEVFEHFKFNRTLVALQDTNYPQHIKDIFDNYKEYNMAKNLYEAEVIINAESNKINNILNII